MDPQPRMDPGAQGTQANGPAFIPGTCGTGDPAKNPPRDTGRTAPPKGNRRFPWQQRTQPWDNARLLEDMRQQARALGPLRPDELEKHVKQQVEMKESARRSLNNVFEHWHEGNVLVEAFYSGLWLRDPQHRDKTFMHYAAWVAREFFNQNYSAQTLSRRMVLTQSYTLEEAMAYARDGICSTVLSFVGLLEPVIRKDILQVAREVPSDWVFKIGNEAQRRYQRAANSDALTEAQAGIERLLRKYKDQLEQRRNGKRGGGEKGAHDEGGTADPAREAELCRREEAVRQAEKALAEREQSLKMKEEADKHSGGDLNQYGEMRLREAVTREMELKAAQEALAGERAALQAMKQAYEAKEAELRGREEQAQAAQKQAQALLQREAEVVAREQAISTAYSEMEQQRTTHQPREDDLAGRLGELQRREAQVAQREEEAARLKAQCVEGLEALAGERQRVREVAAEMLELRRRASGGIVVLPDRPEDLETAVEIVDEEAEKMVQVADIIADLARDDSELPRASAYTSVLGAWLKVEHAREYLLPVMQGLSYKMAARYPEPAEKAVAWCNREKLKLEKQREEAKKDRARAASRSDEEDEDGDEDEE